MAQAASHRHAAATLQGIKVNSAGKAGGTEIVLELSHAVKPRFSRLSEPDRLIVDLPETEPQPLEPVQVNHAGVRSVRASQYKSRPLVTRVVVDLDAALAYDWRPAGNRVIVHVQPGKTAAVAEKAAAPAAAPAPAQAPAKPAPSVAAGIPGGGSALTAGSDTAVLQLARGGELRVCPGTTVAVTQGSNGITLGLNYGAMELHYHIGAGADVVMTPDFRLQLSGPGEFHVAISTDHKGNTCVRGLPGNNVPVAATELLGDGAYLVRPREQIVFRSGSLANVAFEVPAECGCPAAAPPTQVAGNGAPQGGMQLAGANPGAPKDAVDTPLVYRGDRPGEASSAAVVAALPVITRRAASGWEPLPLPAPELASDAERKPEQAGVLTRIRRFFGGWFKSK